MREHGSMLAVLDRAERALGGAGRPSPLLKPDDWETLFVNYEPPFVERLWQEFEGGYRLYLHRIYPCDEALFHPHPWPSAVRILSGSYEMGIGYRIPTGREDGSEEPPRAVTSILRPGTAYEMIDMHAWHSVKPLGGTSYSIMITGPKWNRWSPKPKSDHKLGPVSAEAKIDILSFMRKHYRLT